MAKYLLSETAKEDIIRIYRYGVYKFGELQAEKYYNELFEAFDSIADRPYSFESVHHIRSGYRRCICGVDTIYFKINNDLVEIMTIIGRQDFL